MGATEGYSLDTTLVAPAPREQFVHGMGYPELTSVDSEAAGKIGSILCNREEVYMSFREPDVLRPADLQHERIAELQVQRVDLLRQLHLGDVMEVMRDPQIYFEGITMQFFEECGPGRRVFDRGRYIDNETVAENAYTSTYRKDQNGIIEPEMRAQIGFTSREVDGIKSNDPQHFEITTDLQNTKPGFFYIFSSTVRDGFTIAEKRKDEYDGAKSTRITDPIDRFTLLQALTVDMTAALHNLQPESDARIRKIISNDVYRLRR